MSRGALWRLSPVAVATVLLPGVAAGQPVDPTAVVDASGLVRAAASFVLVLAVGGILVYLFDGFVDRSVDSSAERPLTSVVYGLLAHVCVVFGGFLVFSQLSLVSSAGMPAGLTVVVLAWVALSGLGLAVVGTTITEVAGERRLWLGTAVGAAVSAVIWVVFPFLAGVVVLVVLVSMGIGGPTRKWLHATKSVDVEPDA